MYVQGDPTTTNFARDKKKNEEKKVSRFFYLFFLHLTPLHLTFDSDCASALQKEFKKKKRADTGKGDADISSVLCTHTPFHHPHEKIRAAHKCCTNAHPRRRKKKNDRPIA
jgi:hypothetical protein